MVPEVWASIREPTTAQASLRDGQMASRQHRQHKGLNNRAENSHQPTRVRERRMRRFKSAGQAQRFLSAFEPIRGHFHPKQHELSAKRYREQRRQRFEDWQEITCLKVAT